MKASKNMQLLFTTIVLFAGCLLAIQGSINSQLGTYLKNPFLGALVNFIVGTLCLLIINLVLRPHLPSFLQIKSIPWYLFLGGLLGSMYVLSVIFFVPKLGISTVLAAAIAGQLIAAAVIDNFGFFGINIHPISIGRIAGIILLIISIFLIQKY